MGSASVSHPPARDPFGCRLVGPASHRLDSRGLGCGGGHSLEPAPARKIAPVSGWSTMVRQVALTYSATMIVALAARQAKRPDLIRSPKRVLAHTWEG
jgi:hypothetical protein